MRAQIISFHCVVKNKLGQVLSSSFNQDVINQRDMASDRLPGLVDGLQSVQAGEKRSILVSAERAYGTYDPRLIIELQRSELEYGDRLMPGSQILRCLDHASEARLFRVIRLDEDSVVIDGNHPLAGHDLIFEVEIVSAREAHDSDFLDDFPQMPSRLIH
jgi:FKBP-type peptidyl-prolyl cis-trans isomerase SlyD